MRRVVCACLTMSVCGLLVSAVALAQDAVRDHDITIDDYPSVAMVVGCAMSPKGEYVAYSDLRWKDVSDRRDTDIWLVPATGGEARRLTFDPASDGSPQWSPDGKWIYFTSARGDDDDPPYNGKTQVWKISIDGERLVPVTRYEKGVNGYELSSDGRTLYYLRHRDQDDDMWKDLRSKHADTIDFSHGTRRVSEIWKLNLQNWRTEKLVDDKQYIHGMEVSPDEKYIAMHTAPDDEMISNEGWSRVDVYEVATGEIETLPDKLYRADALSPYGWLEEIAWSSDSKALAFSVGWDGYPNELFVAEWAAGSPAVTKLRRPDRRGECRRRSALASGDARAVLPRRSSRPAARLQHSRHSQRLAGRDAGGDARRYRRACVQLSRQQQYAGDRRQQSDSRARGVPGLCSG